MKRSIIEGLYNPEDRSRIYCYTPQLCNKAEISKRRTSILHRNADFRSTRGFRLIERYSSFISDWETFKNDLY